MELEFKQTCLDAYGVGAEQVLAQEETAETIVPDYCPDIARIVRTDAAVFVHSRELRDGRALASGTVRVGVLYIPEGEHRVRLLEFAMPFSVESEQKGFALCQHLSAEVTAEPPETRILNPRKIFTRCHLTARLTGYQKAALLCRSDVEAAESLCLETRTMSHRGVLLTHIAEKDYTFSDGVTLSPGREGASELLGGRVRGAVTETKLVGNKLLFKGVFKLELLYQTRGGGCCATSAELPFSQLMDVENAPESAAIAMSLQLTGTELQLDGGDEEGREIAVTLYYHAAAMLRQEYALTLLHDLYSTAYEVGCDFQPLTLTDSCELLSRRQAVREVLEIGTAAESVLCVNADCGPVTVLREGGGATLRTDVFVRVLYTDESGAYLSAERSMEVTVQGSLPGNGKLTAVSAWTEEVQGTVCERGIELRFLVQFQGELSCQTQQVCIVQARLNETARKDMEHAPSLVLRRLGAQESVWDLAKRYNTTIPDILAANRLETEEAADRETPLLIPRKRA